MSALYEINGTCEGTGAIGVAVSSRHQLDEHKIRPGVDIDIAKLLQMADDDMQQIWRCATTAKGQEHPADLQEFRQRRVENISWRIWMGQQTASRSPDDLREIELPEIATPDHDCDHDHWVGPNSPEEWALAIHGGAGSISDRSTVPKRLQAFQDILAHGQEMLRRGEKAADVVESVVVLLEDCPFFNAGKGSVLTADETFELDAGFMDGSTMCGGGCATCSTVKNPITLARLVCEQTPHVLLVGLAADSLAAANGLEMRGKEYFLVQERLEQLQRNRVSGTVSLDHGGELNKDSLNKCTKAACPEPSPGQAAGEDAVHSDPLGMYSEQKFGTVGCCAKDRYGNVAAAASTGGLCNKHPGRVGDTPVMGAGFYAANDTGAISCTGKGEIFIMHSVANQVATRMRLLGESVDESMRAVILGTIPERTGGAIAVDRHGTLCASYNTPGMFTGMANNSGLFECWDRYTND